MQALTDYEKYIFDALKRCELKKWYVIKSDRPDREQIITTLKKRIDIHKDLEFNSDYSMYRFIGSPDEQMEFKSDRQINRKK